MLSARLSAGQTNDLFVVREKSTQRFSNFGLTERLGQPRQMKHVVRWSGVSGDEQDGEEGLSLRDAARKRPTVHSRHHVISDDRVDREPGLEPRQFFSAAARFLDVMTQVAD